MTEDNNSQLATDQATHMRVSPFSRVSEGSPHVLAVIARNQVIEIWKIHRQGIEYRERETDLPKEICRRVVDGCEEQREILRTQVARQEWGQFIIERYHATRMPRLMPSIGLTMLIPGTLLAAGSATLTDVPAFFTILKSALIIAGGLLAMGSGWRTLTSRIRCIGGAPVEAFGVSRRALGLPDGTVTSESIPAGYRPKAFKGQIEIHAPTGEWIVMKESKSDFGWHSAI